VDRAGSHIHDELAKTVARGVDEVGRYRLQTFYDVNLRLYFSASPNRHACYLLIERCESVLLTEGNTRAAALVRSVTRSPWAHVSI
jgi:hypothetical protein